VGLSEVRTEVVDRHSTVGWQAGLVV
jgi:hypothetical protein